MRKRLAMGLCIGLCLVMSHVAAAQPFDGSVPLLCTPVTVLECQATGECQKVAVSDVNLPQFIKVNISEKRIRDAGTPDKTTAIKHVVQLDGRLILQGDEANRGWMAVISKQTGKMSLTVAEDQTDFVIFGACINL